MTRFEAFREEFSKITKLDGVLDFIKKVLFAISLLAGLLGATVSGSQWAEFIKPWSPLLICLGCSYLAFNAGTAWTKSIRLVSLEPSIEISPLLLQFPINDTNYKDMGILYLDIWNGLVPLKIRVQMSKFRDEQNSSLNVEKEYEAHWRNDKDFDGNFVAKGHRQAGLFGFGFRPNGNHVLFIWLKDDKFIELSKDVLLKDQGVIRFEVFIQGESKDGRIVNLGPYVFRIIPDLMPNFPGYKIFKSSP